MTFDQLFLIYYTLYRAEATAPSSSDDEYTVAVSLFNEAVNRWEYYDAMYWNGLFTTLQTDGTGATKVLTNGTATYAAPTNMREAGGYIRVNDANGKAIRRFPIIQPNEAQFKNDESKYAYFTGNPSAGFTLHLNPVPDSTLDGLSMNYVYYKKATRFASGGNETTEMDDPMFMVHRALSNRFRASRNPYTNSAKTDAENALGQMKMNNDSGNWANPWKLADNSGTVFGQENSGSILMG